jgi:hypothetical protein
LRFISSPYLTLSGQLTYLSKQEPERRRAIVDHGTEPAAHGPSKLAGFCYTARSAATTAMPTRCCTTPRCSRATA